MGILTSEEEFIFCLNVMYYTEFKIIKGMGWKVNFCLLSSSHSFSLEARAAAKVLYCGPGMWKVPPRACLYPGLAHYSPQAKSGLLPIFPENFIRTRSWPSSYVLSMATFVPQQKHCNRNHLPHKSKAMGFPSFYRKSSPPLSDSMHMMPLPPKLA